MIYKTISLHDEFPSLSNVATLTSYCISNHIEYPYQRKRRTIIVFPGGGYGFVSEREGEPIALKFIAQDFNVFVLRYTVAPNLTFPYPFVEAFAAIAYVRRHAEEYNVDPKYIGVMGFSAGGHLAATVSCYQKEELYAKFLDVKQEELRIDFTILSYPVTFVTENELTFRNMVDLKDKTPDYFDIPLHVKSDFPPTLIWTTYPDDIVPYNHSERMQEALDNVEVKVEYYLFALGGHGGATCDEMTNDEENTKLLEDASEWISLATKFIKSL